MIGIFVGDVVPDAIFSDISRVSPSTNNMELFYIDVLSNIFGSSFYITSRNVKMRNLNNNKSKLFISSANFSTNNGHIIRIAGFVNNRILINISSVWSLWRILKKIRKQNKKNRIVLIVNNHFYGAALPAFLIKRREDIMITIMNEGFDVRFLREHKVDIRDNIHNIIHKYIIKRNDGIITFNKNTVIDYARNIPFITLTYACDTSLFSNVKDYSIKNVVKTILYAGYFAPCYGIFELIEAIDYLPGYYRLILCGGGEKKIVEHVEKMATLNPRIVYLGMLPRKEVIRLEQEADILALIRVSKTKSEKYIAKYNQPSKLPEYLLSGTPIIATDIEGIPEEFKEYLNLVNPDSCSIADEIQRICSNNTIYVIQKAIQARAYAIKNCNTQKFREQIENFIFSIINMKN